MAVIVPAKTEQGFQDEAFTRQFVMDKLTHFGETLRQLQAGSNMVLTRAEIGKAMNGWLETLCELDELQCTGPGCRLCRPGGWRNDAE